MIRFKLEAVGSDTLAERRDLTDNRVVTRLTLARHTGIKRNGIVSDHLSPPRAVIVTTFTFGGQVSLRLVGRLVRRTIGTSRA